MKCKNCGNEIPDNAKFCNKCGAKVEDDIIPSPPINNDSIVDVGDNSNENKIKSLKNNWNDKYTIILIVVAMLIVGSASFILNKNKDDVEENQYSPEQYINNNLDEDENRTEEQWEEEEQEQETEEETYTEDIHINRYAASSTLYEKNYNHEVANLFDNNKSTCWCEGASDDGEGEFVDIYFDEKTKINSFTILNGYQKNEELYYKNNRIKSLTLLFDDGKAHIELSDNYGYSEITDFYNGHVTTKVTIVIDSVYKGNKYSDTCVSDISFNE